MTHGTIRVDHFGFEGSGATVKLAKQDAARQIEHALFQAREGINIVAVGADAAIVAFDMYGGWGYQLLTSGGKFRAGRQHLNSGFADKQEVLQAALRHLIDNAWTRDVPDDEVWIDELLGKSAELGCPLAPKARANMHQDLLVRFAWQRRYWVARGEGYDDRAAHAIASGTPREQLKSAR